MRKDFILPDEPEFDSIEKTPKPASLPKNNYGRAIPKKSLSNSESNGKGKDEALLSDVDILKKAREAKGKRADENASPKTDDEEKKQDEIVKAMTRSRLAPVRRAKTAQRSEEKLPRMSEEQDASGYYERISSALSKTKFVVLLVLGIYVLSSLFVYGDKITYENARLLFYDFQNAAAVSNAEIVDTIKIPGDESRHGTVFRGELCFASKGGLRLMSTDGKEILYDARALYSPALSCSDRFAILYDRGYNSYSVYNSHSLISEHSTEFPIMHISSAQNGNYAVLTRTREYRSAIEIYSPSFKLKQRIKTDAFVLFTDFSKDGKTLVTVSIQSSLDSTDTHLTFYELGKESAYATVAIDNTFPLGTSFYDDSMTLLTDSGIYCIDLNGEISGEFHTGLDSFDSFALYGRYACVYSENTEQPCAVVCDASNGAIYKIELSSALRDISFGEDKVFLLLEGAVLAVDLESGVTEDYSIEYGGKMLLVLRDDVVCVVRSDSIDCIHLD